MAKKIELALLGNVDAFEDALTENPKRSLSELLQIAPALSIGEQLDDRTLKRKLDDLMIRHVPLASVARDAILYAPPGIPAHSSANGTSPRVAGPEPPTAVDPKAEAAPTAEAPPNRHPARIHPRKAVAITYRREIEKLSSFLRSRLSVLVSCEKLIVPHLWREILDNARLPASEDSNGKEIPLKPVLLEMPASADAGPLGGPGPLEKLRDIIKDLKDYQVLVVPNLDLLGGGQDRGLSREARELIELVYGALDRLVLAFCDPSLPIPEVLAGRFAVRLEVVGLPRDVPGEGEKSVPVATALIEESEARLFKGLTPEEFYKNIAGLNPIRFREAMTYAVQVAKDQGHSTTKPAEVRDLVQELRVFKAQTSELFVVPDVTFESIGGYDSVKHILGRAIELLSGAGNLPDEKLRHELIPRGFLFHGPPGTGKTLFAKAVANQLNATIRVVSGPEVTDMYVGESERKVRAVFAQARRNAPSVIVFDEFDSIAAKRSGRDDGGSRAGNALVAQILTEMDGFRPEVPILVIGTTNRLELIDEALLRPSRFQAISIGLPDVEARRHIAMIQAKHFGLRPAKDEPFVPGRHVGEEMLDLVANATASFNGDEIRSIFRDACLGLFCENPSEPVTAKRVGFLVGRVHARRDAQKSGRSELRAHNPAEGRRAPSGPLLPLTAAAPSREEPVRFLIHLNSQPASRNGDEGRREPQPSNLLPDPTTSATSLPLKKDSEESP